MQRILNKGGGEVLSHFSQLALAHVMHSLAFRHSNLFILTYRDRMSTVSLYHIALPWNTSGKNGEGGGGGEKTKKKSMGSWGFGRLIISLKKAINFITHSHSHRQPSLPFKILDRTGNEQNQKPQRQLFNIHNKQ